MNRENSNLSHLKDQLLVMDAQDGSQDAMDEVVRRWQKRLWRHAFRLVRNEDAAWDVMQAVWYDIIKGLRKLNDPAAFKAWAYKITTFKSIDWIKNKRSIPTMTTDAIDSLSADRPLETGIDELLWKLDVDKRAVLSLYYFEDLTISEIGETLKIPAGTVKSRLYTARNALKDLWKKTCQ
jgi:RNA polymerase sigma-70 factor (ECF subfamily)